MKKAIVLSFLLISAQTFAASKSYVGKLVTNIQESNGAITPFSLITDTGTIKLKINERQFMRALYKLSGRILQVAGNTPDNAVNPDELIISDIVPTRAVSPDFDWDYPNEPIDFDLADSIEVSQYTVLMKEIAMEGTIRSEWGEGKEIHYLKLASTGEDKKVMILQDVQAEFYEKYHNKEVTVLGTEVFRGEAMSFVVSQIELK